MFHSNQARKIRTGLLSVLLVAALWMATGAYAAEMHVSGPFKGVKANTGNVTYAKTGGKITLTLSDDFKVPQAPDPHWQIIDSKGNVYMLHKLSIKGNKINKSVTVPAYIHDIAKVQMWCAFAEVNLGEAVFDKPILLSAK